MNSQIRQLVVKQVPQAPARPANVPSRYEEAVATLRQWDVRAQLAIFGAGVRAHLHRARVRQQARVAQWHWPQISFQTLRLPWDKLSLAKVRRTKPAFRIKWPHESQLYWNVAALALILALAMIAAIARHSSTTPPVSASSPTSEPPAALPALTPAEQQVVQAASSKSVVGHVHDAEAPSSSFKRVWVRKDEVDYIADDVTIRHFHQQPAPTKTRAWKKQVNIGEDVTVRYFNPPPAPATASSTEPAERSVKD
jgi:hypothetical protein